MPSPARHANRPPHYLSLAPLLLWRNQDRPLDWAQVFGRSAELVVELGCGNGELLVRRALAEGHRDFVGVDLDWGSVKRALRRIAQSGAANIRLVQSRAPLALLRLFGPRSLSEVYAPFPCPWPNDRHLGRRLFSCSFLSLVANRLKDDARLWIVSDEAAYLDWVQTQVSGSGMEMTQREPAPTLDTKYERKWRGQGLDGFERLMLVKQSHPPVTEAQEPQMKFHWIDECRLERLALADHVGGRVTVSFKDFIYDPRSEKGMLRTVVVEDGIKQGFWIEAGRDPEPGPGRGPWRIRPAPGCGVLPTKGVQRALDLARDAAAATAGQGE